MPKRNSEVKLAYYRDKIRRIEEKERKKPTRRARVVSSDVSDAEENTRIGSPQNNNELPVQTEEMVADESTLFDEPASAPPPDDQEQVADTGTIADLTQVTPQLDEASQETVTTPDLDPEILQALGAKTSDEPLYGDKIHDHLAQLWLPLLTKGMNKDDKDKTLKQYLIPQNCTLLQAPKLNLEISAALSDSARNKDKKLVSHQQQLGLGITAVNRAMDSILSKDATDKVNALKHLSNACRILCDLHHINSQVRVKLITPSLDKSFLNIVQDAHRDETLFGTKLSEKIKTSKTIEKQGLQIKKVVNSNPAPSTSNSRPNQNRGNWTAPPRFSTKSTRGGSKRTSAYRKPPMQPPPPPPPQTRQAVKTQARAPAQQ